jgi:transcriptional regulator with XRE-family HTH domain
MNYSEKILRLMNRHKVSAQTLAASIGVSDRVVNQWTSGARHPRRPQQLKLAEYFALKIEELFDDDVPLPSNVAVSKKKIQPLMSSDATQLQDMASQLSKMAQEQEVFKINMQAFSARLRSALPKKPLIQILPASPESLTQEPGVFAGLSQSKLDLWFDDLVGNLNRVTELYGTDEGQRALADVVVDVCSLIMDNQQQVQKPAGTDGKKISPATKSIHKKQ